MSTALVFLDRAILTCTLLLPFVTGLLVRDSLAHRRHHDREGN